ncbi:ABC1 domain protein [Pyronema domesticum]|uniref:Similar to ABC1 family protein C10F6.14c acc. no. O42653 n=1 Tax=Pyronema omphalodes (strain CBS 100304) TaxID=1076935 RepID=U4L915_PYROM|nr:ABC1 domain protein [Pyronema domesticum]CCX10016.1 Similar to ABC1 family protein C10F6.14c; acc. no. O42653 [Pyronema omphalodes CBS 100304]
MLTKLHCLRSRPPIPTLRFPRNIRSYNYINGHTQHFSPLVPPPPSSLPKPHQSKLSPRSRKYVRRFLYTTGVVGTLWAADVYLNYATFTRNIRTVTTCMLIAADYKLNFSQGKDADQLSRIHERNADRILNLCLHNGGLYQKIGQAIAMQSAILPKVVQEKFSQFFDETPQAGWKEVEKVLKEEYGHKFPGMTGSQIVDQIFMPGSFEKRAVGSASIAQVHKARLPNGDEVAVKIQKPWIQRQVGLDLFCFKAVTYFFSTWMFGLPLSFIAPYICERLYSETDFFLEAENASRTASFIASEPTLKNRVYVPKTYPVYTTKRILVAEWINGISVAERQILTSPYRDDNSVGHPVNTPRSISNREGPIARLRGSGEGIKSNRQQRIYGLGVKERDVMQTMVDVFCAQMFLFGWVHCDPHPGNILVRRLPSGKPQLVLLDHGLYITTTPEFRHQYALFWKSLFTFDNTTIASIASSWGIGNSDLFASATLLKPYQGGTREVATIVSGSRAGGAKTAYEANQQLREKIAEFIIDQDRMPQELVFIGRNLRIVQANNHNFGAPVNRLKVIANWASYALTRDMEQAGLRRTWKEQVKAWWGHMVFKVVVFGLDLGFWWGRVKQRLLGGVGFEEGLEQRLRQVAKREFGVELPEESMMIG